MATRASGIAADLLRELLDHAFADLDVDDMRGPILQAVGLRVRLEVTDLDLVVRVATADEGHHWLVWDCADEDGP